MSVRSMAYDLAYPDESTRAYSPPTQLMATDVGKVARQFSDNTYWEVVAVDEQLTYPTRVTWRQIVLASQYIVQAASQAEETAAINAGALIVIRTDLL